MRARDELEAAYFALLRAREELSQLERFREYLDDERRRLRRFVAEGSALDDTVAPRFRRRLAHTDRPLADAVKTRQNVIEDELQRLPARITAAQAFVDECEREHADLKQAR